MLVRKAIEESLKPRPQRVGKTTLWVSDVGSCPRRAMMRCLGYKPEGEFPLSLREKFRYGVIFEDETGRALKEFYGDSFVDQLRLKNKIWSGKADFLLKDPLTLIEHKATGSKYWGQYEGIPREAHVAQIVLYGQLYTELFGREPKLLLVYRAWSNYAELEIVDRGDIILCKGMMDDEPYQKELFLNVSARRQYLEEMYGKQELPPVVETSDCEFAGKPSCQYYHLCFGEKPKAKKQQVKEWGLF
ncbi:MAG: hypothetical protein H8D45_03600 [Bacteroidetes bacterium]|nr:hypothetical protein [Bacteroidota bacterium]